MWIRQGKRPLLPEVPQAADLADVVLVPANVPVNDGWGGKTSAYDNTLRYSIWIPDKATGAEFKVSFVELVAVRTGFEHQRCYVERQEGQEIATVTAAVNGASSWSQKLTNSARMVASQTRTANVHEPAGILAIVNGC